MKYFIVDAFTDKPFGGNTAGVVLLGGDAFPDDGMMTRIAAELRYSETAFVRQMSDNAFHLRFFTPAGEVDLCGHATIASFALLHRLGIAAGQCSMQTLAGSLSVEVGSQVMMQMAVPHIVSTLGDNDIAEACRALGLEVSPTMPAQIVSTGLPDIMLPVADVDVLNAMQPDMDAVVALTRRLNAVSIHAFALSKDHTAHVRDFAPAYDIPEESATGTANAALTYYLYHHGVVGCPATCSFLQGEAMGRPSVVRTQINADATIFVGGTAAIVAQGELLL